MSKIKFNWKSAAGEIIYIFLGITLAIWFQNWNDDRKEQATIAKLTAALYVENQSNLQSLPETMGMTTSVLEAIRGLMGIMGEDYQKQETQLVDSLMYQFLFTPKFNANEEVIREITDSGKLENIKDDSLRRSIVQWNLLKEQTDQIEEIAREQTSGQIVPYLQERFSILAMDQKFAQLDRPLPPSAFQVDNRKVLADFKFENLLEMQYYSLSYQLQYYEQLHDLMKRLDVRLKAKAK